MTRDPGSSRGGSQGRLYLDWGFKGKGREALPERGFEASVSAFGSCWSEPSRGAELAGCRSLFWARKRVGVLAIRPTVNWYSSSWLSLVGCVNARSELLALNNPPSLESRRMPLLSSDATG